MSNDDYDYEFYSKRARELKKFVMRIARVIPELEHVEKDDFIIVTAKFQPTSNEGSTIGKMSYYSDNHFLMQWLKHNSIDTITNYILTIYPIFETASFKERLHTIIHELYHIPPTKKGIKPHTGFGDSIIYKLYEKHLRRLEKLQS